MDSDNRSTGVNAWSSVRTPAVPLPFYDFPASEPDDGKRAFAASRYRGWLFTLTAILVFAESYLPKAVRAKLGLIQKAVQSALQDQISGKAELGIHTLHYLTLPQWQSSQFRFPTRWQ
jgi:hypothetical protein